MAGSWICFIGQLDAASILEYRAKVAINFEEFSRGAI